MLIDALALVGLDALAEVDLGARQNRHQSLRALSAMAGEVMVAVERRTGGAPRPASPPSVPAPKAAARPSSGACAARNARRGLTAERPGTSAADIHSASRDGQSGLHGQSQGGTTQCRI